MQISSFESLAGGTTPAVFSASIFAFLPSCLKWTIHFPISMCVAMASSQKQITSVRNKALIQA
ncbi:MAG: hypothetical protein KDC49_14320 [Saprospiraceae bacterium]|nr:hypothetical protein [Saprospiraceae bacterium]